MKAYILKYNCDSFDYNYSENFKVFLSQAKAIETKNSVENNFFTYSKIIANRLKLRDGLIQDVKNSSATNEIKEAMYKETNSVYASDVKKIFGEFLKKSGEFKNHFKREHLALCEEYSFEVDEIEFEE